MFTTPPIRAKVREHPDQSAIAETNFMGAVNLLQNLLHLIGFERPRFAFGPGEPRRFNFASRVHGQDAIFRQPGKQHANGGHVLFNGRRRAWVLLDVGRYRVSR
jgi:hypothetical protein